MLKLTKMLLRHFEENLLSPVALAEDGKEKQIILLGRVAIRYDMQFAVKQFSSLFIRQQIVQSPSKVIHVEINLASGSTQTPFARHVLINNN